MTGRKVTKTSWPTFNTTTTVCSISGLPIAQDNYFPNETYRFTRHWIFSQNNSSLLKLSAAAKTTEQKTLCQLAILQRLDCLRLRAPVKIEKRLVHTNHFLVVDLFIIWLSKSHAQRQVFTGGVGLPQYSNNGVRDSDWQNYETFINDIATAFNFQNDAASDDAIAEILDNAENYNELQSALEEYRERRKKQYSPALGAYILETLAAVEVNTALKNDLDSLKQYLLNPGYKSAEGYQTVYKHILDAQLPSDSDNLTYNIRLVLNWIERQIVDILDMEAGFFGTKKFQRKSGEIFSHAQFAIFDSEEDFQSLSASDIGRIKNEIGEDGEDDDDGFIPTFLSSNSLNLSSRKTQRKIKAPTVRLKAGGFKINKDKTVYKPS